jgi:hypothetical protein
MKKMKMVFVVLAITIASLTLTTYAYIATTGGGSVGGGGVTYHSNVDIQNLGPDAYDLAVVFTGEHTFSRFFNGYTSNTTGKIGWFAAPDVKYDKVTDTTTVHWQTFNDGTDNKIDNGQVIHVGWRFSGAKTKEIAMYWTDLSGNRIPGSVVYNVNTDWTYNSGTGNVGLHWANMNQTATAIHVENLHAAVFSAEIDLANLNEENKELGTNLAPVPGGEDITIEHGAEAFLELRRTVAPGSAVVLRYKVTGAGSDGVIYNYFQFVVE